MGRVGVFLTVWLTGGIHRQDGGDGPDDAERGDF